MRRRFKSFGSRLPFSPGTRKQKLSKRHRIRGGGEDMLTPMLTNEFLLSIQIALMCGRLKQKTFDVTVKSKLRILNLINRSIAFQNRKYFSRQNAQNTTQMFDVAEMGHGRKVPGVTRTVTKYYSCNYRLIDNLIQEPSGVHIGPLGD